MSMIFGILAAAFAAQGVSAQGLQPVEEGRCAGLASAVGAALGVRFVQAVGPMSYPGTGLSGQACVLSARGTGETFGASVAPVAAKLETLMKRRGWRADLNAQADGPTGTVAGYQLGARRAVTDVEFAPAPGVCHEDEPIASCALKPAEMRFTVTISVARTGP